MTKEQLPGSRFRPRLHPEDRQSELQGGRRCLGPDTLLDAPLELPWAILDAPWAEKNQDFLASLRAHGTKVLLDGSCWRYRYGPTFDIGTMAKASWAPSGALTADAPEQLARFVRDSLRTQAKLEASAYVVPGCPRSPSCCSWARTPKGSKQIRLLVALPSFLSGLYLQVAPSAPVIDSPTKLQRITELYLYARSLGLAVIGGHAGAITPVASTQPMPASRLARPSSHPSPADRSQRRIRD